MSHSYDLAELIGSRICHDLISPIGAINNGIELIEMSSDAAATPEMSLISDSVRSASARIRFFRIAFGAASDQMVSRQEASSILSDTYGPSRLSVSWAPQDPLPRRLVRLGFLSLMCLETAMPYGGQIAVEHNDGTVRITGQADKLNIAQDLWDLLACDSHTGELLPAQVQFGLLPRVAADQGRSIRVTSDDAQITLTF
ncbi:histidine phosphotransferase family protein [Sulfitobacter sp. HNIBRBA3233]|uniref:histidine phosphotransferase family protein n=1 Tax=Sulfitobacter marinivivus TaxID=3158558 RepID=UPI0032DFE620